MKAVLLTGHGGPEMLRYGDAPDPTGVVRPGDLHRPARGAQGDGSGIGGALRLVLHDEFCPTGSNSNRMRRRERRQSANYATCGNNCSTSSALESMTTFSRWEGPPCSQFDFLFSSKNSPASR